MTEIDDESIEKIANAIRNKRISDRWKDPQKAEFWGGAGWYVALVFGVVMVLTIVGVTIIGDMQDEYQEGDEIYQKISLANMDCDALKKTLLDLEESSEIVWVPSGAVQKQITARCT